MSMYQESFSEIINDWQKTKTIFLGDGNKIFKFHDTDIAWCARQGIEEVFKNRDIKYDVIDKCGCCCFSLLESNHTLPFLGVNVPAIPLSKKTTKIVELIHAVNNIVVVPFTSVLIHHLVDGTDTLNPRYYEGMSGEWQKSNIVMISMGETRRMQFEKITTKSWPDLGKLFNRTVEAKNEQILIMHGTSYQQQFRHSITKVNHMDDTKGADEAGKKKRKNMMYDDNCDEPIESFLFMDPSGIEHDPVTSTEMNNEPLFTGHIMCTFLRA